MERRIVGRNSKSHLKNNENNVLSKVHAVKPNNQSLNQSIEQMKKILSPSRRKQSSAANSL